MFRLGTIYFSYFRKIFDNADKSLLDSIFYGRFRMKIVSRYMKHELFISMVQFFKFPLIFCKNRHPSPICTQF